MTELVTFAAALSILATCVARCGGSSKPADPTAYDIKSSRAGRSSKKKKASANA